MGYKLIALDIDGTLLNSSNQITENVKEAIRKSKEKVKNLYFPIKQ